MALSGDLLKFGLAIGALRLANRLEDANLRSDEEFGFRYQAAIAMPANTAYKATVSQKILSEFDRLRAFVYKEPTRKFVGRQAGSCWPTFTWAART